MAGRVNYEDLIFDLYIFSRLERKSGNMTTAKLLFLLEEKLFEKKIIGPHYILKKYPMGPYNNKIGTNIKNLAKNGYLNSYYSFSKEIGEYVYSYTGNPESIKFLSSIDDLIQEFSIIFNELDMIIDEFGVLNSKELMDYVYSIEIAGRSKKKIQDYQPYSIIINPLSLKNPNLAFILDSDWYDTIEILLNPDLYDSIKKSLISAQTKIFKPL